MGHPQLTSAQSLILLLFLPLLSHLFFENHPKFPFYLLSPTSFVMETSSMDDLQFRYNTISGSAEVGVQGVPGHTQYLPPPLVKTKFWLEKFEFVYLWAHTEFVSFHCPCICQCLK